MAKKKENELSYLQMPLPTAQKKGKMAKLDWSGLNYRNTKDTGEISKEKNISTHYAPYLTPSRKIALVKDDNVCIYSDTGGSYKYTPTDIFGYDDTLIVQGALNDSEEVNDGVGNYIMSPFVEYLHQIYDKDLKLLDDGVLKDFSRPYSFDSSIVNFLGFDNYANIANVSTFKRLLFFPSGYSRQIDNIVILKEHFHTEHYESMALKNHAFQKYINKYCTSRNTYYYIECANDYSGDTYGTDTSLVYSDKSNTYTSRFNKKTPWAHWEKEGGNDRLRGFDNYKFGEAAEITLIPKIFYACTAHQRLFGIDEGRVFASGFNDYANWTFDTADSFSAENAWMSSTQSTNGGANTGIIAYGSSVFVFKKDSTFEITNTKNPFRINEVFPCGAISQKAIQVVGNYMIFVGEDGVKLYNGSSLKDIGYKLNIDKFNSVVSGTDGRKFYMYCGINDEDEKRFFVYDTHTGLWAEEELEKEKITTTIKEVNESGNETEYTTTEERPIEFVGFAKNNNGFFALSSSAKIYRLDTDDYDHDWSVETDFFTNNTVDIKHIGKLQMLADIAPQSTLKAYILYDDEEFDENTSHKIFERKNEGEKTAKVPIRVIPRKTANYGFKIHIEGHGFSKLYQMELLITGGGEKYVSE